MVKQLERFKAFLKRCPGATGVYIWNILFSVDCLGNALIGGNRFTTLSGRMGKLIRNRKCWICKPICWFLGKLDKNHCANQDAIEVD